MKTWPLIVLRFDRMLAPSSASRANFTLMSGTTVVPVTLEPRIDPIERTIVIALSGPLLQDTAYTLIVQAAADARNALRAYDGALFEGTATIPFKTRADADAPPGETPDVDVKAIPPCGKDDGAIYILQRSCTGTNCHGTNTGATPAMGLSLISDKTILDTAVGRASVMAEDPANVGGAGEEAPQVFPYGMPIIQPGSSAGSFLIYKLLMRPPDGLVPPDLTAPAETPALDVDDQPLPYIHVAEELSNIMPGAAMPHPTLLPEDDSSTPTAPLTFSDLRTIRAWIDDGAPGCAAGQTEADAGVDAAATNDAANDAADSSTDG